MSDALDGLMSAIKRGDHETALQEALNGAQEGTAACQNNLALVYALREDFDEALKWWSLAAEQGMVAAQYSIGCLYAEGRGVPRDPSRAAIYFRRPAEQGHAPAQYNLGNLYLQGEGVPYDASEAYLWLDRAVASYKKEVDSGWEMRKHQKDAVRLRRKARLAHWAQRWYRRFGRGTLFVAAATGDLELAQRLLKEGGDVNAGGQHGGRPLINAAVHGKRPVAEFLIENGADINGTDTYGGTALYAAVQNGHW